MRFFLKIMFFSLILLRAETQADAASFVMRPQVINPFGPKEVPVLIVMGQSNAEGFNQWLPDGSRASVPLKMSLACRDQGQAI